MPTYDYVCDACGHRWEAFQSMTAKPEKACPSCGKRKARRLIGIGAAVLFKGSGFYQTDYRSESYTKAAEAEKKASEGGAKSADPAASSGDAKPAESKPATSAGPAKEAGSAAAPKGGGKGANTGSRARSSRGGGKGTKQG